MIEFNLSNKEKISEILGITYGIEEKYWYAKKDVKEFIRLLKERFDRDKLQYQLNDEICRVIDKIAGEKLI